MRPSLHTAEPRRAPLLSRLLRLSAAGALLVAACSPSAASDPPTVIAAGTATPSATATLAPTSTPEVAPTPTASATAPQQATPTPLATPMIGLETSRSCASAEQTLLQDVTGTPAGPYLVHHPMPETSTGPTVLFIPGGSGSLKGAQRIWDNYLSNGRTVDAFRFVIPYTLDGALLDETTRIYKIVGEVLSCYGGDPDQVHIAGFSNGGLIAFSLMLSHPTRFATLLGAPGDFPTYEYDPTAWGVALAGKAVFNGVGENDDGWKDTVKAVHNGLVAVGVDSVYVEFAGQGHGVSADFDEDVFFDFWTAHSTLPLLDDCS